MEVGLTFFVWGLPSQNLPEHFQSCPPVVLSPFPDLDALWIWVAFCSRRRHHRSNHPSSRPSLLPVSGLEGANPEKVSSNLGRRGRSPSPCEVTLTGVPLLPSSWVTSFSFSIRHKCDNLRVVTSLLSTVIYHTRPFLCKCVISWRSFSRLLFHPQHW